MRTFIFAVIIAIIAIIAGDWLGERFGWSHRAEADAEKVVADVDADAQKVKSDAAKVTRDI